MKFLTKIRNRSSEESSQEPGKGADRINEELTKLADARAISRLGLWILGVGFCGFLIWAGFAPLDQGVPTSGTVVLSTKKKVVQHLQGGIVQSVHVREGDQVSENDLLIKLIDSNVKAGFESIRQQLYGLRITEARLIAEQAELAEISLDTELVIAAKSDKGLQSHIFAQQSLFKSKQQQLSLLKKELFAVRELVKDGYATLVRQMELERQVLEYRKDVEKELSAIRPDLQAVKERYKAAQEELNRTEIRAPASGQVVGLAAQTVGGVITPGQKVMDIVPGREELIVEAQVAPHLIDRIRVSDLVDIRFYSFPNTPQLVIEGALETLSTDVLTNPNDQSSYYLARVRVTERGVQKLGERKLQAGMPAEVVIKTGTRTLIQYLLHPLIKRMAASMKEE
jgi:protease secretion system membrane fusion protein